MISTTIGVATDKGPRRALNCDAHAHHVFHDRLAVAVVDGTGTSEEIAEAAQLTATVAARVAARRTPVHGIVVASEVCADPGAVFPAPSGTIAVATAEPGGMWRIAWAGDCTAHAYRDDRVWRVTTPHTRGQEMRDAGEPEDEARRYDHQVMRDVSRVDRCGVESVDARCPLLVLASDGLLRLGADEMADILRAQPVPQDAADALLETVRPRTADDITVLVVSHPEANGEEVTP